MDTRRWSKLLPLSRVCPVSETSRALVPSPETVGKQQSCRCLAVLTLTTDYGCRLVGPERKHNQSTPVLARQKSTEPGASWAGCCDVLEGYPPIAASCCADRWTTFFGLQFQIDCVGCVTALS